MTYPASLIIIAMLGIALLVGDYALTLGNKKPRIPQQPASLSGSLNLETFSLQPITGLAEAQKQVSWYKPHIPKTGNARSHRLSCLARLHFFLGDAGDKESQKDNFTQGAKYAKLLSQEQPQRVEGYYWLALNLCGLAGVMGAKQGLDLLPRIISSLKVSLCIDEAYDQAGAHRVLGRIFFMAPCWPLSEGDFTKSRRHLAAAVKIAPENSTNHLFLAETLYSLGEEKEANRELEEVLDVTQHALWPQGLEDDQQRAQELREKFKMKRQMALFSGAVPIWQIN